MSEQVRYAFGNFTYDALSGLRREGEVVALALREQWLLLRLLDARGDVVSHESLRRSLFGNVAIVPSLYRSIQILRQALDDSRRNVVVSVRNSGYRIGVPVTVDTFEPPHAGPAAQPAAGLSGPLEASSLLAPEPLPNDARLADATTRLERALETSPDSASLCSAYAHVLITRMVRGYIRPAGHGERAFDAVDRALATDPDHAPALAAKGWLCGVLAEDRPAGISLIQRAQRLDPGGARAAFLLAWLLVAEQQLEAARLELERAISDNPFDFDLMWMQAWLLSARRQYVAARSVSEAGLRHAPGNDLLWVCDAIARARLGERRLAQSSILTASRLSPRDWLIRANVGWVRFAVGGRFGYAELISWLAVQSLDYTSPFMSAVVCHAMGDRAASAEFLRFAQVDRDPWGMLAWCDPRLQT